MDIFEACYDGLEVMEMFVGKLKGAATIQRGWVATGWKWIGNFSWAFSYANILFYTLYTSFRMAHDIHRVKRSD